jgi:esterase/lipase superfamily enzyme
MEQNLERTIPLIWNKLPPLFGNDWPHIERELWELLRRLEAGDPDAAAEIIKLFAEYPQALAELQMADQQLAITKGPLKGSSETFREAQLESRRIPAGSTKMQRHVVVPVMYGTDRKRNGNSYGGEPNEGKLSLGVVKVSVPEDHYMGVMEHPPWWKFGFGWDPNEHVMVLSVHELVRNEFIARSIATLAQGGLKQALVFIHGFNVTFDDATRRAAQLAYDLRFKGLSMMYSWPSLGRSSKRSYDSDADKIIWTRPRLLEFLRLVITELGLDAVHVIAHSMGNRALTDVLRELLTDLPQNAARLRQVVFAAPDVNARTFQDLATKFAEFPERCTLYASSEDRALKISRKFNNSIRAGDSGGYLVLLDRVDTIDAAAVRTDFMGHSSFGDNTSIVCDLDILIRHGHPPNERPRLLRKGRNPPYWVFQRGK